MKNIIEKDYYEKRKEEAVKIVENRKCFVTNKKFLKQFEKYLTPGDREYFIKDYGKADELALMALKITVDNLKHEKASTSQRYFYFQIENQWISSGHYNLDLHFKYNTLDFLVLNILFRKTFKKFHHGILFGTFFELAYKLYCFNMDYNEWYQLNEESIFNLIQDAIDEAYSYARHTKDQNKQNNMKTEDPKDSEIITEAKKLKSKDLLIKYTNKVAISDACKSLGYSDIIENKKEINRLDNLMRQRDFRAK